MLLFRIWISCTGNCSYSSLERQFILHTTEPTQLFTNEAVMNILTTAENMRVCVRVCACVHMTVSKCFQLWKYICSSSLNTSLFLPSSVRPGTSQQVVVDICTMFTG